MKAYQGGGAGGAAELKHERKEILPCIGAPVEQRTS
jgi:hypothetical protein